MLSAGPHKHAFASTRYVEYTYTTYNIIYNSSLVDFWMSTQRPWLRRGVIARGHATAAAAARRTGVSQEA